MASSLAKIYANLVRKQLRALVGICPEALQTEVREILDQASANDSPMEILPEDQPIDPMLEAPVEVAVDEFV